VNRESKDTILKVKFTIVVVVVVAAVVVVV